jgi:hypothetical protein
MPDVVCYLIIWQITMSPSGGSCHQAADMPPRPAFGWTLDLAASSHNRRMGRLVTVGHGARSCREHLRSSWTCIIKPRKAAFSPRRRPCPAMRVTLRQSGADTGRF